MRVWGVERELCSPPLGGQTGSAARRRAGRRQAQRARAWENERGGGGSGAAGAGAGTLLAPLSPVRASPNELCATGTTRLPRSYS